MSVQTQIDRIRGNVSNALSAIAAKGVTVPEGGNSDVLAELIAALETGGGSIYVGSVTFAEDSTEYIDIEHNLGVQPQMAIYYAAFDFDNYTGVASKPVMGVSMETNDIVSHSLASTYNATSTSRLVWSTTGPINSVTGADMAMSNEGGGTKWAFSYATPTTIKMVGGTKGWQAGVTYYYIVMGDLP